MSGLIDHMKEKSAKRRKLLAQEVSGNEMGQWEKLAIDFAVLDTRNKYLWKVQSCAYHEMEEN